jgi:hypothetical protein
MAACRSRTASGQPCRAHAISGSRYCFAHDPGQGAKRALARKTGGQRRRVSHGGNETDLPSEVKTLDDANKILAYVLAEIIPMENSIPRARVLLALFDSYLKSFEIGELEGRLTALEQLTKN